MIAGYEVSLLIFWSILMTGMAGALCFAVWRIIIRRMGSQGNAVHIYRWLKAVIAVWILPVIFIAICLYVSRPNAQGALEGLYFRRMLIENPTALRILILLWGVIAIIQMSRYLVHWIRHRQALRGLPRVMAPSWRAEAESIAGELGIRRRVDLREVPGIGSPMLVGLIRPMILLDGAVEEREAQRIILYHELHHYKQRDLWWQVWMSVLICLNWFNPLCYKLHRDLREWSEAACDARTCRQGAAEFSPKEYLYQVIAHCRPVKGTGSYYTRAINEVGNVESFKSRVDRLFAAMDTWEAGGWRYWAKPALYMGLAILGSIGVVYGTAEIRNYLIKKTTPVVESEESSGSFEEFIVKSCAADDRPSAEKAPLFPNEEHIFSADMEDGLAVYRLCPEEGRTVLNLAVCGDRGVDYEFGIFTRDGGLQKGDFQFIGQTGLGLQVGTTYYIYVRDVTKSTEDICFMYFWKDEEWLEEYESTHS